jgi:ribosomal protein L32
MDYGLRKKRIMLGPFSNVYRQGNLLFFKASEEYRSRVLEESLKPGLKISPGRIAKAYKDKLYRYWILVDYERGYDLYKHFKLAPRDKNAWRIPRITVEVCPTCGEDIVERVCLECGEKVGRPRHIEVWRDPEAVEELIPITGIKRRGENLTIESETSLLEIPKEIIHEKIVSIVRKDESIYVKLLKIKQLEPNDERSSST